MGRSWNPCALLVRMYSDVTVKELWFLKCVHTYHMFQPLQFSLCTYIAKRGKPSKSLLIDQLPTQNMLCALMEFYSAIKGKEFLTHLQCE